MTNTEILDKAEFRKTPDGQWRYHVDLRKAFNVETLRDATNQWIEKCVAQPVMAGFFEFYFWTGGADGTPACKALLNQLRSTDLIKIVRMY